MERKLENFGGFTDRLKNMPKKAVAKIMTSKGDLNKKNYERALDYCAKLNGGEMPTKEQVVDALIQLGSFRVPLKDEKSELGIEIYKKIVPAIADEILADLAKMDLSEYAETQDDDFEDEDDDFEDEDEDEDDEDDDDDDFEDDED